MTTEWLYHLKTNIPERQQKYDQKFGQVKTEVIDD